MLMHRAGNESAGRVDSQSPERSQCLKAESESKVDELAAQCAHAVCVASFNLSGISVQASQSAFWAPLTSVFTAVGVQSFTCSIL